MFPPHCRIVPTGLLEVDIEETAFATKAVVATVVELSPAVAVVDVIELVAETTAAVIVFPVHWRLELIFNVSDVAGKLMYGVEDVKYNSLLQVIVSSTIKLFVITILPEEF